MYAEKICKTKYTDTNLRLFHLCSTYQTAADYLDVTIKVLGPFAVEALSKPLLDKMQARLVRMLILFCFY